MAKINYKSDLEIVISKTINFWGATHDLEQRIGIPIHSFEVTGGTNRKINLASADQISVAMEFEQARTFKNLVFYIPPTKDFLAVKLLDLANQKGREFGFYFVVGVYYGTKLLHAHSISAESARFLEIPTPVGDAPPLLMAKLGMNSPDLQYGKGGKDGTVRLEEI